MKPLSLIESELLKIRRKEELVNRVFDSDLYNLGTDFLNKIMLRLADTLQADFTFVSEFTEGNNIQTLALVAHGELVENITYSLTNTPCELVFGESICSFDRGVTEKFPEDQLLKDMQIEGYVGAPLFDSDKNPTGILVALYQKPLQEEQLIRSVFHLFAARIGAEMEHMKIKQMLEQRNLELKAAKEKAEESDRLKTAFLNTISHEIRTPMNAMLGFSSLLKQGSKDKKERDSCYNIIQTEGEKLLSLLDNILEFSASTASPSANQSIPLSKSQLHDAVTLRLVTAIGTGANPELRSSIVIEQWECAGQISMDNRTLKVLEELFANSVKFTEEGTIHCGIQVSQSHLNCTVTDTGQGIPTPALEYVFDHFRQVEQGMSRSHGGLGLGLSICRKRIESMGGEIQIVTTNETGTGISFSIPLD